MSGAPSDTPGCPEPEANRYETLDAPALRALLAQRDAQLAEQADAMQEWMHAVSHDLRAPLRHITSYGPLVSELLQEAPGLEAEARQEALAFLATMDQSARRMGRMLEGLLVLSRIARAPLRRESVDLAALVEEARAAQAAAAQGRAVQWQMAPDLPVVQGDAPLLRQMLAELLGNALKFTRGRDPACIAVGGERGADGRVTLTVRDNGAGFNPAQAAGLFGVFQRLHRESEFEGVGAGLAAVRAIARRHGGEASATAAVGEGCTVRVSWPG
ncbi:sensor histidine kinase [Simplicispira lacusdiani]|uniref:sensor histidine kinase n=1 Tax=Simplicispira lacusdiani TaxID=2213010 RepID=UPI000E716300|nr:ATP-binding protein [Simplicispira lacusdiani]